MSYESPPRLGGFADLALVVVLVAVFDVVVALSIDIAALRVALGLPVVLLAPGYAVVAALYPRGEGRTDLQRPRATASPAGDTSVDAISPFVRAGLTVAASVAVVATVALAVNASPWAIRPLPTLAALTVATLAAVAAAAYRRSRVPARLRYAPSTGLGSAARVFRPRLSATFVLALLLVASAVGASAVLATTDTNQAGTDEQFTEFAALTQNATGEYVTANYTGAVAADRPIYVEVINGEGERTDYTVVLVRETVERRDNVTVVRSATERVREDLSLRDGAIRYLEFDPEPAAGDAPSRLRAYLYRGDAPEVPSRASAYRSLQVWYTDDPIAEATAAANATDDDETAAGNATAALAAGD
ncbi:DUF1616 domain-containing protein [Halosimplex pelagicum]|uniref:DUF1616 domain-containing protein n=1 Tax=Halosimplex pelagicum TaxID=869886 RepID=A0A7D5TUT5_9EURY|nr:DUF1616 domain-containing protein [Halosimplex pelagicum]QLH82654.1 DUF1616 domain-containing protein [Halosimplex pelagicum]